ncbi:MAG: AMP-dependent synthetase [Clostridia bacterium]|nr:AMP-binding protein [Eubacteriales bacterium]MDD3867411.1 AMP-binding protein [Eubacteriales bacterium]NCC47455.1 AMP-dependent synthetase [Clostridia bacterium]
MQTVKGTQHYQRQRFRDLRELLRYCATEYADLPVYRYHDSPGGRETVHTYREYVRTIDEMGTGLAQLGLKGAFVAIVGANAYEWAVSFNSVVNGLGVAVPLDRQLPEPEVISLCERGKAEVFIYNSGHQAIAEAVAATNPKIRYFICMKAETITPELRLRDPRFIEYQEVIERGRTALADGDRSFVEADIDPEALCSLLFTSGTTAMSKGVMLSHRNITHNVHAVTSTINVEKGQRALSVLPLHHTFENTVGMYMMQAYGCSICFTDGLRYISDNFKEWEINILLAVPLLFENIYHQIQKTLQRSGKLRLVNAMRKISNVLRFFGIDIRRKLFHQIIDALGGGLKLGVSGAAAIDKEIVRFFNEIGIDFFAGYGLTETSPVVAACNEFVNVYGSVGQPLSTVEVAIDTDDPKPGAVGEILTRSESVMMGYYENESATAEAMTADGWFRTGDSGYLDKKGCLFITGRIKSMIVLTNGKKAFPEEIEFLIAHIPGVKESIVWGESSSRGAVDICAKLVLDPDSLPQETAGDMEKISVYMNQQISEINRQMPPYKAIKYFVLSETDLVKTTTLKVKRPMEHDLIHQRLEALSSDMRSLSGKMIDA